MLVTSEPAIYKRWVGRGLGRGVGGKRTRKRVGGKRTRKRGGWEED